MAEPEIDAIVAREQGDMKHFFDVCRLACLAPVSVPSWFKEGEQPPTFPKMPIPPVEIEKQVLAWSKDPCYELTSMFRVNSPEYEIAEKYRAEHLEWKLLYRAANNQYEADLFFRWRIYFAKELMRQMDEDIRKSAANKCVGQDG